MDAERAQSRGLAGPPWLVSCGIQMPSPPREALEAEGALCGPLPVLLAARPGRPPGTLVASRQDKDRGRQPGGLGKPGRQTTVSKGAWLPQAHPRPRASVLGACRPGRMLFEEPGVQALRGPAPRLRPGSSSRTGAGTAESGQPPGFTRHLGAGLQTPAVAPGPPGMTARGTTPRNSWSHSEQHDTGWWPGLSLHRCLGQVGARPREELGGGESWATPWGAGSQPLALSGSGPSPDPHGARAWP